MSLDLSIIKVIHSGEIMLNSKRNTYVLTQTDPSYRKLETLCKTKMKTSGCRKERLKQLGFLTFEPGHWRPDCPKRILFWSKTSKSRACSGVKHENFGACSGFLEVKNRPWSVAHTLIPDIRKFPHPPGCYPQVNKRRIFPLRHYVV